MEELALAGAGNSKATAQQPSLRPAFSRKGSPNSVFPASAVAAPKARIATTVTIETNPRFAYHAEKSSVATAALISSVTNIAVVAASSPKRMRTKIMLGK